ncbi:MAG: glycoside hydrolase family 2 TIM barrel-domain containing protein [Fimbriimonadaceae bacterium]|nr:glycoside hydrolase family 2 TIM barrel-domain containing protein [Fimbriimonadaceae bacterium]
MTAILTSPQASAPAPATVWIEGEAPTSANTEVGPAKPENAARLRSGAWLNLAIPENELAAKVPAGGVELRYDFTVEASGDREIWGRIGFEFARSPFEWRIDQGPWQRVSPDDLTTDLVPLSDWTEVAWIKFGTARLTGKHRLGIRIAAPKKPDGKPERLLFAADAFAVAAPGFTPYGAFESSQVPKTAADQAAAAQVFQLPASADNARPKVSLAGSWEVARHDEQTPPFDIATPIEGTPKNPVWTAIPVPSDRNVARPDLVFAHRLWYRTRVNVPAELKDRGFRLSFGQNNLNTTVLVNGQLCGFEPNPHVAFAVDCSRAMRPGINEIWVGIRDAWYGYSTNPKDPMKLRRRFNQPLRYGSEGFQDLAYPIWNSFQSGILDAPVLEATGPTYAQDVFVRPSVAKRRLEADVEVLNPGSATSVTVEAQVVDHRTGEVALKIPAQTVSLGAAARQTVTLGADWANPTLWWPDRPHLYRLRTMVRTSAGTDTHDTRFGFREWGAKGMDFTLNGQVWRGWAELVQGDTRDAWLANYRKTGQRFQRMSGTSQNGGIRWNGMPFTEALDWCDENGVVIRRSGILDGQVIGYMAIENDPDLKALYKSDIKQQLMENWRRQMVAQVKAERNHPSIHLWSLENEWLYINCINLYGDKMDAFEREVQRVGDAVAQADPTRLWMVDGGGAAKANTYPVHGDHYVYTNDPNAYPALAYQDFPEGGGRGRWVFDKQRPRYAAEDFFATGINPADYAWIGGEVSFTGKVGAHLGIARVQRMLTEGYRSHGTMSHAHHWVGDEGAKFNKHLSNAERAVFVREYDSAFASGQSITRTLTVLNDSRYPDPITLTYAIAKPGATGTPVSRTLNLAPGEKTTFPIRLTAPTVAAAGRFELQLELTVDGKSVFRDVKRMQVYPDAAPSTAPFVLLDPKGEFGKLLRTAKFSPTVVAATSAIPKTATTIVVAPDALSATDAARSDLAVLASAGKRVIVLEQSNPLVAQGLPVPIKVQQNQGAFAYLERSEHPVLQGLQDDDFWAWPGDHVFRNAYEKPVRGARSLIQCHRQLGSSALIEAPVGEGLMLLCQANVGSKFSSSVVARKLLSNMLRYAATYRAVARPVTTVLKDQPLVASTLAEVGLKASPKSVVDAIAKPGVAIVAATPANLKALRAASTVLNAFFAAGGDLVLTGLTPEGIGDYNAIVGVNHAIRPFRMERTGLVLPKPARSAGLTQGDAIMLSNRRLFAWTQDMYIADDVFSHVVDSDDVAPFAKLPNDYFYNTVNGMVSADGWPYIFSFDLKTQRPEYTMEFDREYTFRRMEWTGNGFYHLVTKLELTFDGANPLVLDVLPNTDPQMLDLQGRRGRRVGVKILDWKRMSVTNDVVGIDNIRMYVDRGPEWKGVQTLMNPGGIVFYPKAKGGITLVNLKFQPNEPVPENAGKKQRIFAGLLRNLNAAFTDSEPVILGAAGSTLETVSLAKVANQYRGERGWYGNPAETFRDMPFGNRTFNGVPFDIYELPTSPTPNCVMLGGPGVPGNLPERVEIPVNRPAKALVFLHTARIDRRLQEWERGPGKREIVAEYLVTYADGSERTIPLIIGNEIADFRQTNPRPLDQAAIGWQARLGESDRYATAYLYQWNNPSPEKAIRSVTLRYPGSERFGVPALLGLTIAAPTAAAPRAK